MEPKINQPGNSDDSNSQDHVCHDKDSQGRERFATVPHSWYTGFAILFVATMLISNIVATKGVTFGSIITDGAFYLFPLAYILGDVISEVYGFKAMRRVIWFGFGVLLLAAGCFWITIHLPAADFYEHQSAFEAVAGTVPQIFLASLAGYLIGELLNSYVLVKIKARTGEKLLWVRLLSSTVVGEFADTLIFCSIAATAIGISTVDDFSNYVVVGFLWKTGIEIIILPVTYRIVRLTKKHEPTYTTQAS